MLWDAGGGADTWPLASFSSIVYRQQTMTNCDDATALLDFLGWTQLDADAIDTANKYALHTPHVADVLCACVCGERRVCAVC